MKAIGIALVIGLILAGMALVHRAPPAPVPAMTGTSAQSVPAPTQHVVRLAGTGDWISGYPIREGGTTVASYRYAGPGRFTATLVAGGGEQTIASQARHGSRTVALDSSVLPDPGPYRLQVQASGRWSVTIITR